MKYNSYDQETKDLALKLIEEGRSQNSVSKELDISRSTVRYWLKVKNAPVAQSEEAHDLKSCKCGFESRPEYQSYSYIIGAYLGDGYINKQPRTYRLNFYTNSRDVEIYQRIGHHLSVLFPNNKINHIKHNNANCVTTTVHSQKVGDYFPQHGAGKKHERSILLEDWQEIIVNAYPHEFLRGLIDTDGTRFLATVYGKYEYPRYQFVNLSEDIKDLFCKACDLVGVCYTRPQGKTVNVYQRDSVKYLDESVCFV